MRITASTNCTTCEHEKGGECYCFPPTIFFDEDGVQQNTRPCVGENNICAQYKKRGYETK